MSSEAAQKAYPDTMRMYRVFDRDDMRVSFDAGAVEALKQAAAAIRGKRNNPADADWLEMMADEWEAGQ